MGRNFLVRQSFIVLKGSNLFHRKVHKSMCSTMYRQYVCKLYNAQTVCVHVQLYNVHTNSMFTNCTMYSQHVYKLYNVKSVCVQAVQWTDSMCTNCTMYSQYVFKLHNVQAVCVQTEPWTESMCICKLYNVQKVCWQTVRKVFKDLCNVCTCLSTLWKCYNTVWQICVFSWGDVVL